MCVLKNGSDGSGASSSFQKSSGMNVGPRIEFWTPEFWTRILGSNFLILFSSKRDPLKNSPSRNSPLQIHLPKFNPEIWKKKKLFTLHLCLPVLLKKSDGSGSVPGPPCLSSQARPLYLLIVLLGGSFCTDRACGELRATISRHLLPPISRWGKTMDSYRKSCRNSEIPTGRGGGGGGFSGTGKGPIPLRERGDEGDTKW